jgi:hypothetical protein
MDSALLELKEALGYLTDYNQNWSFDSTGADANGLGKAYQVANSISEAFGTSNSSLMDGWATAADLLYKLFQLVHENFGKMYEDIDRFSDEGYQAEVGAKKAVDTANEAAQSILNDLGLGDTSNGSSGTSTGGSHPF